MRNETRIQFNRYLDKLASLNSVANVATKFSVAPSVQQTLEAKIQESSEFLSRINMYGVNEKQGEKIGMAISSTIASTTDTSGGTKRAPAIVHSLDGQGYDCTQTNFDTAIRYAQLDAWAKFPNFQTLVRDQILKRQALDRIMIGFNGTARAATSNRLTNPLLQDVNIGWLEKIREYADENVISEGATPGELAVGATGDYKTLDALVMDMVNSLLDPWFQDDTELVVVCGRALLFDKYFPLVNADRNPTERLASDLIVAQKRIGNLPAVRVPHFPANALMVTRLDNLSIYFQEGARRRHVKDNPELDQIENYESSNDAYVVEDYGCAALAENIVIE